jgi:regulator of protease activity HflC (stomatin/prohibitin superfamily)
MGRTQRNTAEIETLYRQHAAALLFFASAISGDRSRAQDAVHQVFFDGDPQALENAMSQQAQAERERQARVILGEAELQVSEQFAEASRVYNDNPGALHLRGMNMLYEAIREKGAMVIVPSSAIETMGLGSTLAATTLAKQQ